MNATVNLSLSDYMNIARLVDDSIFDERGGTEVEYTVNGYTLLIEVEREIEYRDVIGGSYEGYDFERLTVIDRETFDVLGTAVIDPDGCNIDCYVDPRPLLDILN
jgi:hypothetical protein